MASSFLVCVAGYNVHLLESSWKIALHLTLSYNNRQFWMVHGIHESKHEIIQDNLPRMSLSFFFLDHSVHHRPTPTSSQAVVLAWDGNMWNPKQLERPDIEEGCCRAWHDFHSSQKKSWEVYCRFLKVWKRRVCCSADEVSATNAILQLLLFMLQKQGLIIYVKLVVSSFVAWFDALLSVHTYLCQLRSKHLSVQ